MNDSVPQWKVYLFLILVVGPPFFGSISQRDFWHPDEPRFAQIAREMNRGGDYVVPHLNREPNAEKPPLFYWLIVLFSWIGNGGVVSEGWSRMASATTGFCGVLATYWLGRRLFQSQMAGLLSALILATTFRYFWLSQYLMVDMTFSFFAFFSIYLFQMSTLSKRRNGYIIGGYTVTALAVLAKGPLALIFLFLAFVPYFCWAFWRHRKDPEIEMPPIFKGARWGHILGLVLFLALSSSWYLAIYFQSGWDFLYQGVFDQNFRRFTGQLGSHIRPFYYYFLYFPPDFLPWFAFFPGLIFFLRKKLKTRDPQTQHLIWLMFFGLGAIFFLSLSKAKFAKYLLPAYPSLALLMGYFLWKIDSTKEGKEGKVFQYTIRWVGMVLASILLLGAVAGVVISALYFRPLLFAAILTAVVFLVGGTITLLQFRSSQITRGALALSISILWGALAFGATGFAPLNHYKSPKPFGEQMSKWIKKGDPWCMWGNYRSAFVYYSGRFCERLDSEAWEVRIGKIKLKDKITRYFRKNPKGYMVTNYTPKFFPPFLAPYCKELYRHKIGHRFWYLYSYQLPKNQKALK